MNNSQVPSINPRHCHPETPSKGCWAKWLQGRQQGGSWVRETRDRARNDSSQLSVNIQKHHVNLLPPDYACKNHYHGIQAKYRYLSPPAPPRQNMHHSHNTPWWQTGTAGCRHGDVWGCCRCGSRAPHVFAGDKGQCAFQLIVVHALTFLPLSKAAAHLLKCQRTNGGCVNEKIKNK